LSFVKYDRVADQYRSSSHQQDDKDEGLPYQKINSSPSKKSLEDEIASLRIKMERAVWQEQSMTKDIVVKLSSMLDHKINEYMKIKLKKS
jgi:hypothetical protein